MNPKNLPASIPKAHFEGLRRILYLRRESKTSLRSGNKLPGPSVFCQHIVDVYLDLPTDYVFEDFGYQTLVSCSGILEAKKHACIKICPIWGDEGRPFLVRLMHGDLVISRIGIHEGKVFVIRRAVYQSIDAGEQEGILGIGFVQIGVIDAHSPLPVCFLHQDRVLLPRGVGVSDPRQGDVTTSRDRFPTYW
ncbi:hypothetical protein PIB30_019741 [Stylosanthes scabra]|uniref:Uncharacterized protein n=1 Tax=Stylosanthes scabra TaxID=79078 RepID=A0ABU6W6X9_9FABA|nr:hypothetical protein [Stylosanthes scabra]